MMFLKQMKIIGFKSFVEPTVIEFRSDRVAIVGPNGCGKSNIIDAIRWVMGESSPKFLRGDLMADVIFNGSLNRKPMGLASVEIILDNAQNLLQGAYVKKGDISLRREVNRLGESSYYINQQRVRRKDVSDLWLGTGAGARGYAIIGQNMVNQLVEANPEVLKAYLEEAAGVSKYKERRKESSTRLVLIHDNIARISDIIAELDAQLTRLAREASDAKQYHLYKQNLQEQESLLQYAKYKSILLKKEQLDARQVKEFEFLNALSHQIAAQDAAFKELDSLIVQQQEQVQLGEQGLYKLQMDLNQQTHLHEKREQDKSRYVAEKDGLRQEISQLQSETLEQANLLAHLRQTQTASQAKQAELNQQCVTEALVYDAQVSTLKKCRRQQQDSSQELQKIETEIQVLHVKLEQAAHNMHHYKLDLQHAAINQHANEIAAIELEIQELQLKIEAVILEKQRYQEEYQACQAQVEIQNIALTQAQVELNALEQQHQQLHKDYLCAQASYEGLLTSRQLHRSEIGQEQLKQWLETWQVPPIWQGVVDFLWQYFLPHGCVDMLEAGYPAGAYIATLIPWDVKDADHLLHHFGIDKRASGFFDWTALKMASTTEAALLMRQTLQTHESIVTPDGLWLGVDWQYQLSFEQKGLASRLQVSKNLQAAFTDIEKRYQDAKQVLLAQQQQHQINVMNLNGLETKHQSLATNLEALSQKKSHLQQKLAFFKQEQLKNHQVINSLEARFIEASQLQKDCLASSTALIIKQKQVQTILEETMAAIHRQQAACDKLMDARQALKHQQDSIAQELFQTKTKMDLLQQGQPKLEQRLVAANARLSQVDVSLLSLNQDNLWTPERIAHHQILLQDAQEKLSISRQTLKNAQMQKQDHVHALADLKKQEIQLLEKKWRIDVEKEQIEDEKKELEQGVVIAASDAPWMQLKPHEDALYFKKKIIVTEQALLALGDVNLLALGLYDEQRMRHDALLLQLEDLQHAMKELEAAIETLDQDMQLRLEETLRLINEHLQDIFPQLFGGGQAKFVASCDNLLEATVSVNVQLPGKKQHRIQLLSGGEKALTAVALLFAIFSLNPAPFCLLDEVDAALDDANVQRLANVIKTLSETVQFVLITHNPLTMDAADDLVGVTMQEPGVSRVVSVNMAMALEMVNKE
ncbi:MAG: hypothetical protein EBY16_02360 [Gammaproteobacteria bacterium]|nr:hypothetical protein [Gammaproteobacteria bacterium]